MAKRLIAVLLAALLLTAALTGCAGQGKERKESVKRLSIVTTIFPEYDWVMQVLGDRAADADVTLLIDSGVDLHNYQPTADDMIRISTCDLFINVGGESDQWVDDALKAAVNQDMIVLDLLELLGDAAREEEVVEGMQAEAEDEDEDEDHDGMEYDEHIWLSLRNAAVHCEAIRDALTALDHDHAREYADNATAYIEKLNELDRRYQTAVDAAGRNTILFADRFPFRYLTEDYGLSYYAAFAGCSAETEASFETVAFLADKVRDLDLSAVLTLEGTDHRIAQTVIAAAGTPEVQILSMDSMQSVTAKDVKAGTSYLERMEKNLTVLQQALQ